MPESMMNWEQLLNAKRLGHEHKYQANSHADTIRTEFERDYDRIIFSYPFRRLQDKTQVVPLPEHDFVHTRLTHSLEVSVVGRTLGKTCGRFVMQKYPKLRELGFTENDFASVTAAASLAHDIGNPPFGHAGEEALSELFQGSFLENIQEFLTEKQMSDLQNFEGNAQGFRILCNSKLEGLKLTYATLGAFVKYPCESLIQNRNKSLKSQKKYGFFQSEKESMKKIASELKLIDKSTGNDLIFSRHPLVFLVEAADDICYSIIDLEDACRMGILSIDKYIELLAPIIGNRLDIKKLSSISDKNEKLGVLRAMAINQLIDECVTVFKDRESSILCAEFDQALSDCIPSKPYTDIVSDFSIKNIYDSEKVVEIQAAGFEILPGLLQIFTQARMDVLKNGKKAGAGHKNVLKLLPENIFNPIQNEDIYSILMSNLDFLSGLTDKHALNLYRKLKGISI